VKGEAQTQPSPITLRYGLDGRSGG